MMRAIFTTVFALFMLAAAGMGQGAWAQTSPASLVEEQRTAIQTLATQTSEIDKQIAANVEDDAKLVDLRLLLEGIERDLLKSSVAFRPRLSDINARIEQLGPAPKEGEPAEPDDIARERQALVAEKASINSVLGVAEDLSIRISTLINHITYLRRELFSRVLTKRYDVNFTLWENTLAAGRGEANELYRTVSAWLGFVLRFKLSSFLTATGLALGAAVVLLIGGRRLFGRLFEPDLTDEDPGTLSKLTVAFWSTLLPSAALGVFLTAAYILFDSFSILRGDIGAMIAALFAVLGLVNFIHRLGIAVLSPRYASWRLLPVRSSAARTLLWLMSATALVSGIDFFLTVVFDLLDSPLLLTVGEALAATVLIGALVLAAALVRPFADEEGRSKPWPALIRYILWGLGAGTIVAALLGYIGLARFISQQIVWTGAVIVTMYIGFLSSRAVSEEGALVGTRMGLRVQRLFGLDETTLDQLSLVLSVLINVLVVVAGVPLILFQWGFKPGDIVAWTYRLATGIRIGSFTLSLTGILWGILVFGVGYFLTRWFQNWLDGSVMARGKVDTGVRNSIRTVIGYAGMALALLVAISAAGIDLSSFALIAGGLSLGIGFGLQNVVSNFVSGLILLAERPFKAGDWIVAGQVTGTVKKISVRATEIETFQRQTVILPNSELINSAVGNWTHRNKMGRIDIKVGVAYDDDVKRAHAIMSEIAHNHPMVLKNPEPFVLFANFGPAALEFEIRVFLADITNGNAVQNDIRFAVFEAFGREGIDIPSTARWVKPESETKWPGDDEVAEAQLVEAADEKAKAQAAARPRAPRRSRGPDPD